MRNHTLGVALVASTLALPLPASAQDAYTIGLTGALTGRRRAPTPRLSMRCASISTA
jgi:hypothetical protein